jgi:hypothetical protein
MCCMYVRGRGNGPRSVGQDKLGWSWISAQKGGVLYSNLSVRNVVLLRVEQGRLLFLGHLLLISEPLGRAILYLHACAAVNAMLRPAEACSPS